MSQGPYGLASNREGGHVEEFQLIRACHRQISHVVGLVEQDAGLLPRLLLIPPVGEFRGYARVGIGPGLLVSEQSDNIAARAGRRPDQALERVPWLHGFSPP